MVQDKKVGAEETKEIRHFKLVVSLGFLRLFVLVIEMKEDHRGKKKVMIIIKKMDFYMTSNWFVTQKLRMVSAYLERCCFSLCPTTVMALIQMQETLRWS